MSLKSFLSLRLSTRGSEAVSWRRRQLYLLPFGVSVLDPLHSHTLIVLVQGGDHRLVDPSCKEGREMLRPGPSSTGLLWGSVPLVPVGSRKHEASAITESAAVADMP